MTLVFFVVLTAIASACLQLAWYAKTPADPNAANVRFEVLRGNGLAAIAKQLERTGIIMQPKWFVLTARLSGDDVRVRAGEYMLSPAMTPLEVLDALINGKAVLYKLTVPEGVNLSQIAMLAQKAGFGEARNFIKIANNPAVFSTQVAGASSLEGYLFPDTYHFNKDETPEKIIRAMTKRFYFVFNEKWKNRAAQIKMSVHEIVTLASIIEKETAATHERVIVSSVYHNRLKKGIRLQSDPTVIYGIKGFDGNITKKHLETPTPYNTYMNKGLPPGPIASPGKASLTAALYPADTKFLYFVAKKDGTHKFSTSLEAHNRAVRKYQLRRRR